MQISKFNLYIFFSFVALIGIGYKVVGPHEGNFYRSVVALTISRWFAVALTNAAIALLLAIFWAAVWIFFQKLHPLESSHLQEKCAYFAFEAVFGLSMTKGSVTAADGALFTVTMAFTMMHAVLVKRMNMLEEAAMTTTKRRIVSVSLLTAVLFVVDASVCLWLASMIWGDKMVTEGAQTVNIGGRVVQVQHSPENLPIFGRSTGILMILLLDWALNIAQCVTATTKLALMSFAARFPSEVTNSVRFYVEIVTEILKCSLYIGFGGMLMHESAMPLHLIHQILSNIKRIAILAKDFVQHRKRMKWIEQVDVPTEEQLAQDCICNICRDEVVNPQLSRILPCSHLFHVDCLAKWLERNRDCPYCQRDVEQMVNQYVAAKKRAQAPPPPPQQPAANPTSASTPANPTTEGAKPEDNIMDEEARHQQHILAARNAIASLLLNAAKNNINNNAAQENNIAAGATATATGGVPASRDQQQQQQNQFQRQVRVDPQTGRIADESTLREMYEQYRLVALKRKEQERMLADTAIALAQHQQQKQNENHLTMNSKNKTSNPRSKTTTTGTSIIGKNPLTGNTNQNSAHIKNGNDDDEIGEFIDVYQFSIVDEADEDDNDDDEISFDDEEEFVVAPSASSLATAAKNKIDNGDAIVAAYERYEKSIEKARKKLHKALSDIKKKPQQQLVQKVTTTTSLPVATNKNKEMDNSNLDPFILVSSMSSIAPQPSNTNAKNTASVETPPPQQECKKEQEVAKESLTPTTVKKELVVLDPSDSDSIVLSTVDASANSHTNLNDASAPEEKKEEVANEISVSSPACDKKEQNKEMAPEDNNNAINSSPVNTSASTSTVETKKPENSEEENNNDNNSPAPVFATRASLDGESVDVSPSASMDSPTSSNNNNNQLMTEGDREESASDFIKRQAQERYLARKRQLQQEKEEREKSQQ